MDEVDISITSDETELFLDLWEAQCCLWDPADRSHKNRVDISVASDETELFLDLWEAQHCLWDTADRSYKNRGTRSVAPTSIAEAFGRGWTIGEY